MIFTYNQKFIKKKLYKLLGYILQMWAPLWNYELNTEDLLNVKNLVRILTIAGIQIKILEDARQEIIQESFKESFYTQDTHT